MSNEKTGAACRIRLICKSKKVDQSDIYKKAKKLLQIYRVCFVKSFSSFSASGNPHFHHEEFLIFSGSIKGGLPTRNQAVSATRFRAVVLCYLLEDHCSSGMQLSVVSACPSSSSFQFNQAFRYAVFSDLVMPFI